MNLILIGPRGVGKSKISRALSKKISFPVVSTDSIAVYELGGISIPKFIERNSGDWSSFRELEKKILQKLLPAQDVIIDCGGGILFEIDPEGREILSKEKLSFLKQMGKLILLERSEQYLIQKVIGDSTRPNLSSVSSYPEILRRRIPLYRSVADILIDLESLEKEEAVEVILKKVGL